jgi:hypothetical protein
LISSAVIERRGLMGGPGLPLNKIWHYYKLFRFIRFNKGSLIKVVRTAAIRNIQLGEADLVVVHKLRCGQAFVGSMDWGLVQNVVDEAYFQFGVKLTSTVLVFVGVEPSDTSDSSLVSWLLDLDVTVSIGHERVACLLPIGIMILKLWVSSLVEPWHFVLRDRAVNFRPSCTRWCYLSKTSAPAGLWIHKSCHIDWLKMSVLLLVVAI